ncbi:L-threonylcarbamoyladenylate synthase [Parvularcula maris]|uniref:L-threonylcarbamoyladenylate synthase n=1 Tax=Parvularcula maris TaxID=2965077 RepID=UPI002115310E
MTVATHPKTAEEAAAILARGQVCALPTETVYGLAADATNWAAVGQIFSTKKRPRFNPLIVHVLDAAKAVDVVQLDNCAARLMEAFWPGPLTIVLPSAAHSRVAKNASGGLSTLAVRSPAHPLFRAVLEDWNSPIVAPSANRSGRLSPTTAAHVIEEFGGGVPVLDGGPCEAGVESTIVSLTNSRPTLLRPGAIPAEKIEAALGHPLLAPGGGIEAPGMMTSHYAPTARVRLNAKEAQENEVLLGFGGTPEATLDLSPDGDLSEAAANLFAYLRRLDALGRPIAVAPIPDKGLGRAINDRLRRAAAER